MQCVRWGPSSPSLKGHSQFSANVCCGQTAGRNKMPLGREVGLGPGEIVLNGNPAPPLKGAQPPLFDLSVLWSKGWMGKDATWYEGRPRRRPHCVRCGPSYILQGAQPPNFGPCLLWPNGWMDPDTTWYGGRPRPRQHCARWGPSSPLQKRGSPQF